MRTEAYAELKWLYCLASIASVLPIVWIGHHFPGITTRGWLLALAILSVMIGYLVSLVAYNKRTLDAYLASAPIKFLLYAGIHFMSIGVMGFLVVLLSPLNLFVIFGYPSHGGVTFSLSYLVAYLASCLSFPGLSMFEASRLFGFEANLKSRLSVTDRSRE